MLRNHLPSVSVCLLFSTIANMLTCWSRRVSPTGYYDCIKIFVIKCALATVEWLLYKPLGTAVLYYIRRQFNASQQNYIYTFAAHRICHCFDNCVVCTLYLWLFRGDQLLSVTFRVVKLLLHKDITCTTPHIKQRTVQNHWRNRRKLL